MRTSPAALGCRGRGGSRSTRRLRLPPLRQVLLGINAHINFDLPQALLAVISDEEFRDQPLLDRRRRDHERIDRVLADRVAAEDAVLADALSPQPARPGADPAEPPELTALPARGATEGVAQHDRAAARPRWQARTPYAVRLAELEVLSAARVADLLAPGQVLLRLAVAGFGVTLPPPG